MFDRLLTSMRSDKQSMVWPRDQDARFRPRVEVPAPDRDPAAAVRPRVWSDPDEDVPLIAAW